MWLSRALRFASVAEKTVYTSTNVPTASAPSPVPLLYPSPTTFAPPPSRAKAPGGEEWTALARPAPQTAPKHCAAT